MNTASHRPRFVAFIDDAETLDLLARRFGADGIYAVSTNALGPHVARWTRQTLERDMRAVEDAHRDRPFAGVLFWREPHVLVGARLAERLHLPAPLPDPALARDKLRMKQALRGGAVQCAECVPIGDARDVSALPARLFPAVLKPRHGFASICSVRVENARSAVRELAEKRDKLITTHLEHVDLGIPIEPEFVLEPFIGGTEHTVESFVAGGEVTLQIVSDKRPMTPPHFIETGDIMPSQLDEGARSRVAAAARRAIAALGIRYGWTHTEIKLENDEPWVMEIGARMGGGYTRELVRTVYGLDMLGAFLEYAASGARPALGPPNGVVLGRRVVAAGVMLAWDVHAVSGAFEHGRVTPIARESAARRRGVFLGAPFSYGGTLDAYLLHARNLDDLAALDAELGAMLEPKHVRIPVPRAWYRGYLRVKRILDDLAHR